MIELLIDDEFTGLLDEAALKAAAQAALTQQGIAEEVGLTIAVDSDERLQALNLQFLGIDAPTDVLSFPADEFDPDTNLRYIGDIILSCPRAQAQAQAAGVSLADEAALLVIHGVLHLLGHDHAAPQEKTAMWAAQSAILASLGIHLPNLPEE